MMKWGFLTLALAGFTLGAGTVAAVAGACSNTDVSSYYKVADSKLILARIEPAAGPYSMILASCAAKQQVLITFLEQDDPYQHFWEVTYLIDRYHESPEVFTFADIANRLSRLEYPSTVARLDNNACFCTDGDE